PAVARFRDANGARAGALPGQGAHHPAAWRMLSRHSPTATWPSEDVMPAVSLDSPCAVICLHLGAGCAALAVHFGKHLPYDRQILGSEVLIGLHDPLHQYFPGVVHLFDNLAELFLVIKGGKGLQVGREIFRNLPREGSYQPLPVLANPAEPFERLQVVGMEGD